MKNIIESIYNYFNPQPINKISIFNSMISTTHDGWLKRMTDNGQLSQYSYSLYDEESCVVKNSSQAN